MAVIKKKLVFILCLLGLLSGCARKTQEVPHSVVSYADVVYTHSGEAYQLTYRHPKKLEAILNFLRCLRSQGRPEIQPEKLAGDRYDIYLSMTDGSTRVHRLQDYTYLCRSGGKWEKIDPLQGRSLMILLKLMPED